MSAPLGQDLNSETSLWSSFKISLRLLVFSIDDLEDMISICSSIPFPIIAKVKAKTFFWNFPISALKTVIH